MKIHHRDATNESRSMFNWPANLNFNLRLAEVDREKEEASMKENRDSNSINGTRKLVTKDKINEKVEEEEE